jgi:hypothetical protein
MSLCKEAREVHDKCKGDLQCLAEHGFATTRSEDSLEVRRHGYDRPFYVSARNEAERGQTICCQGFARSVGTRRERR